MNKPGEIKSVSRPVLLGQNRESWDVSNWFALPFSDIDMKKNIAIFNKDFSCQNKVSWVAFLEVFHQNIFHSNRTHVGKVIQLQQKFGKKP